MARDSKIEWTDDTFNPVIGCAKVAAGCQHCYAERMSARIVSRKWDTEAAGGVRVRTSETYWNDPIRWNRKAEKAGIRRRVFCASWADVFEDFAGPIVWRDGRPVINRWSEAPYTMNDVRADLFRLIDRTPWLDWLLLTKRPQNIRRFTYDAWTEKVGGHVSQNEGDGRQWKPRPNVWLGTSIAVQADADANIPALLKCRELSPVLFLSCEPLLGPVNLKLGSVKCPHCGLEHAKFGTAYCVGCSRRIYEDARPREIDWVIAGGESGPHARPMRPAWVRSLRDQCKSASVPFFFKQWGEWGAVMYPLGGAADRAINEPNEGLFGKCSFGEWHGDGEFVEGCLCDAGQSTVVKVGKQAAGRVLDGVTHDQMPHVSLEVQQ